LAAGIRPDPLGELNALPRDPLAGLKERKRKGRGEKEMGIGGDIAPVISRRRRL